MCGKMIKKGFILFIVAATVLISCNRKNRFDINTSNIDLNIKINRLDKSLFQMDPGNIDNEFPDIIKNYGEFFVLYCERIINIGNPYSKICVENLKSFVTDYTMNKVYEKTKQLYPNLNHIENKINSAFKRYKYYFPEKKIPAVYTYIGGFNQSIVVADSILGIGLDKYLGKDCEFYERLRTPKYIRKTMNPDNIPVDALRSWVTTEFVYNDSIDNLVNNMIYQGKIQYFIDALFPQMQDSLKMGFTGKEIRWCVKNDKQMWNYLVENKLLFSTDYMTINEHINPAPFTSGYPRESPGRASVWLGWQIVKAYMNRNPKVTVQELMLDNDYQHILSDSKYEP